MKKSLVIIFVIFSGLLMSSASVSIEKGKIGKIRALRTVKPDLNFGKLPLYFITNKGQVNQTAAFYAKTSRYTLWLTKEGLVFDHLKKTQRDVSRFVFLDTDKNPEMVAVEPAKLKVNYFKGKDKSQWHCGVPTSKAVLYKRLYKCIDLKIYGIEKQVEYDWIVKPGGNPEDIRFRYKNVKATRIDEKGNLVIETAFGQLMHKRPVSFQMTGSKRAAVNVTFKKIDKNTYGFHVEAYDKNCELIIDPIILAYSTYLGGDYADKGYGIAVDAGGYIYVTGETRGLDFPLKGQIMVNQDDTDTFVTKIDPTQSGAPSLVYSTIFGGSGEEICYGIAVGDNGNAYVTGATKGDYNERFPLRNQYPLLHTVNEYAAFVARFDTTQTGETSLIYSTYLESSGADFGTAIAVDADGNVYVTGSSPGGDFPLLNPYQATQGNGDVFVTRIDTDKSGYSSLIYSTLLGGTGEDRGRGIAVDAGGYVYVTGDTNSTNFPTMNQFQTAQGDYDVFVARLDTTQSAGSGLIYSTFFGGSGEDTGYGIAVDNSGNAYVTGVTSEDFQERFTLRNQLPVSYYDVLEDHGFVLKLDTTVAGDPGLIYSTYLEGYGSTRGRAIAADTNGNVYVTGCTDSLYFPLKAQFQSHRGYFDTFVTKLDTTHSGLSSLCYSTLLGSMGGDYGRGIAVDSDGTPYVTGYTEASNFPVLNQYMSDPGDSDSDAFVTKLIPPPVIVVTPNGGETWQLGDTLSIVWDTSRVSNNLRINLLKDGTRIGTITSNIDPDAGSFSWTVGEHSDGTAAPGPGYTVKIREIDGPANDFSDAPFTLCPLTVTSPNGGEYWEWGSPQTISWDARGLSENVKIVLVKDGESVGIIADNIDPLTGSYTWTVGEYTGGAAVPGEGYTIKIKEKGTAFSDKSDAGFTICSLNVTSPAGGESWAVNSTQTITWDCREGAGDLRLTLCKGGVDMGIIASYVDASGGLYNWAAGQYIGGNAPAGTGYTIKIREIGVPVKAISDGTFSLTE